MTRHDHEHHLAEMPLDLAEEAKSAVTQHHAEHVHRQQERCKHRRRHRCVRKLLGFVALTDTALKAVALHTALKNDDKNWVLPLALINSAGVLPIYYMVKHHK